MRVGVVDEVCAMVQRVGAIAEVDGRIWSCAVAPGVLFARGNCEAVQYGILLGRPQ